MRHQPLEAVGTLEVSWYRLDALSPLTGQALAEADIRARSGAAVAALWRAGR